MKIYLIILLITLLELNIFGQGREIDGQILTLTPQSNDTIISRKKSFYEAKFIIRNNGPDTIFFYDKYSIKVQFSNVPYPPYIKEFNKTLKPGNEDTVNIKLQMTWDTDAIGASFCANLALVGPTYDSIRKEVKDISLNNLDCILVNHKSKLDIFDYEKIQMFIHPNPSEGGLKITFDNTSFFPTLITARNSLGKLISTPKPRFINNSIALDLSNQPNGLYFIELSNAYNRISKSILLMKY